MRKLKIYLDSSVISHLYADDTPEKRAITEELFNRVIAEGKYDFCISELVIDGGNK